MISDQPLAPLGVEPNAVEGDDAGRLLPAMLEGMQAERDNRRRVRMAEDAEDAALLAQPVFVWRGQRLRAVGGAVDGGHPHRRARRFTVWGPPPAALQRVGVRSC